MQSQPTEVSQNEPVDDHISQSISSAQHGIWTDVEPSSSPSLRRDAGEDSPHPGGSADAVSVSSAGSGRGRKPNSRRLKSHDRSSEGSSPGSRIEEYERSHLPSPCLGDGVLFQVIPSVKDVKKRLSVDQFPNGKSLLVYQCNDLTIYRGYHSHPIASAAVDFVCDELGLQTLPYYDNNTSCVENSVLSLLPRSRYDR